MSEESAPTSDAYADEGVADAPGERGRPRWRVALNVLGVLLLVAAVLPFAVYAAPQLAGADQSYVVLSGSMEPAISTGDVVLVTSVAPGDVAPGDVVTFDHGGETTTHRVVSVERTADGYAFTTKGDANEDPDAAPVPGESVVGRVTLVLPFVGYAVQFAGTEYGFVALVAVPAVLFGLNEAWLRLRRSDLVADADAADAVDAADTADTADEPAPAAAESYALSERDLAISTALLLVVVPYSAWMVYTYEDVPSAMVAAGGAVALALLVGVRLLARPPDAAADAESSDAETSADDDGGEP